MLYEDLNDVYFYLMILTRKKTLNLKQGDVCIVNGGKRINPQASLSFTYAWDNQFSFRITEQSVSCK